MPSGAVFSFCADRVTMVRVDTLLYGIVCSAVTEIFHTYFAPIVLPTAGLQLSLLHKEHMHTSRHFRCAVAADCYRYSVQCDHGEDTNVHATAL